MLKSMTGFGRSEQLINGFNIKIQVKSVNHRYSDFTIRVPKFYNFLEDKIRQRAMQYISRGKVEINVIVEQKESDDRIITLNETIAKSYIDALKNLTKFGIEDDIRISTISKYSDIFNIEYAEIDENQIFNLIDKVLTAALDEFVKMRSAEGSRLEENLNEHLDIVLSEVAVIEELSPKTIIQYRQKLEQKIKELLGDIHIDESRILTETAIFADKIAVDEEITRLKSHVNEFKNAVKTDKPIGKKLDFIVQEMNRESNTIGSKATDLSIAKHVVELKSEIEKIREQIQNIE